jgi:dihydroxyacetone kinase
VIVKQYTGDVLNFGLAGESAHDSVRFLIVGDDVAVPRKQGSLVGRRGLAGTCLVYKAAGYLAAQGADVDEVKRVAKLVADNCGTMGSSFAHCHVPGTKKEGAYLAEGQMEVGMGIHNEPGIKKTAIVSKEQLVNDMVELITSTTDVERSFVPWTGNDKAVIMLNNLGGLSELELVGLVPYVLASLQKRGIEPVRLFVGSFMTSLDMPGFSITALRLPESAADADTILKAMDAPSSAPGWRPCVVPNLAPKATPAADKPGPRPASGLTADQTFTAALTTACKDIIAAEPDITRYDVIAGDGDCGLTLKAGASAILAAIENGTVSPTDVANSVRTIAELIEEHMGGTSGALYAIFCSALARALEAAPAGAITPQIWASAAASALDVLKTYTPARPPSRTLMDPLVAFIEALPQGVAPAAEAARAAALNTAKLVASAGRAAYVDQEALQKEAVPDPGAWGLAVLFGGFASAAK